MVLWDKGDKFTDTPVYEHTALQSGNIVEGPALVEAEYTTFVVPEGARITLDRYMNCIIEWIR